MPKWATITTVVANTLITGMAGFFAYHLLRSPERLGPFGTLVTLMAFCTFLTWVSSTLAPLIAAAWRPTPGSVQPGGTAALLGLSIGFLVMHLKL